MSVSWNPHKDLPSLAGKVAVVTGTTSGIGRETVKHLALGGAKVYCAARSESKASQTNKELLEEHPTIKQNQLVFLKIDVEVPESIQGAVAEVKSKEDKIDILINNAGGLMATVEKTEYGWERHMAMHLFGSFLLTNGLMPLLKTAASIPHSDVRVIYIASAAPRTFLTPAYHLDFSSRDLYRGKQPQSPLLHRALFPLLLAGHGISYSISKLAVMLFAAELQTRLDKQKVPILSISVDPGAADSRGNAPSMVKPFLRPMLKGLTVTTDVGSWNSLFMATAKQVRDDAETYKGKYFEPVGKPMVGHPLLEDVKQRKAVWEVATAELNEYLSSHKRPLLQEW